MTSAWPKQHLHYGWIVAGVTFVVLLVGAGIRATPGILIVPLKQEFGWSTTTISGAVAINILLYGLLGPFAVAVMERFGLRRLGRRLCQDVDRQLSDRLRRCRHPLPDRVGDGSVHRPGAADTACRRSGGSNPDDSPRLKAEPRRGIDRA